MLNIDWNSDARNALGLLPTLNSLFGLWPLDRNSVSLRIRWCISTLSLTLQILLAIYETKLSCNHAKYGVDNLLVMTFGFIALAKMIFFYKNRDKLRLNVVSAIEDWSSEDLKKFSTLMIRCRTNHTRIARICLGAAIVAATGYSLKVFLIDSDSMIAVRGNENYYSENVTTVPGKRFLFPAACPLSNVSQYSYRIIVAAQFLQIVISVGVNLACDAFFIAITHHLCGQFAILKRRFSAFEELDSEIETRRNFDLLIDRHTQLLKLARVLEDSFTMIVFTQIIMNFIVINVAGFNFLLFLNNGEVLGAFTNIAMIHFALVETYMYSYIGDNLSNDGSDIAVSAYDSAWHTMPNNLTKDIAFVMTRASFSFHLTAGKFFKMTRGTFTDIVKTAFSYLSILRILINEKKF